MQQFNISRDFLIVPLEPILNYFSAILHVINIRILILLSLMLLSILSYLLFAASFKLPVLFLLLNSYNIFHDSHCIATVYYTKGCLI